MVQNRTMKGLSSWLRPYGRCRSRFRLKLSQQTAVVFGGVQVEHVANVLDLVPIHKFRVFFDKLATTQAVLAFQYVGDVPAIKNSWVPSFAFKAGPQYRTVGPRFVGLCLVRVGLRTPLCRDRQA